MKISYPQIRQADATSQASNSVQRSEIQTQTGGTQTTVQAAGGDSFVRQGKSAPAEAAKTLRLYSPISVQSIIPSSVGTRLDIKG